MDLLALVIVSVTVWFVYWLNQQKRPWIKSLLDWFPAILFAYVIPALITHAFGLDLAQVQLHQISKDWIIPLAILCVMSALSFAQLRIIGFKPILLFVSGSVAIATLPVLLVLVFGWIEPSTASLFISEQYWKGLVPIVGGWIGGSTSQLVLKELAATPEGLFLSVLVLDNILVNIWTILMFQVIQRSNKLNQLLGIKASMPDFVPDHLDTKSGSWSKRALIILTLLAIVAAAKWVIPSFLWKVVLLSILGLILGNLVKGWDHTLVLKVGGVLIVLIMAILGLKLNFAGLSLPLVFVIVVILWLLLHYLIMIGMALLLRVHMAWVPIASMANLGGISTAPAVTAAYNEEWMPHAILLAILSMVTGTGWGMVTLFLFGLI